MAWLGLVSSLLTFLANRMLFILFLLSWFGFGSYFDHIFGEYVSLLSFILFVFDSLPKNMFFTQKKEKKKMKIFCVQHSTARMETKSLAPLLPSSQYCCIM